MPNNGEKLTPTHGPRQDCPPRDFASAYDGIPLPTKGTDWQDAMYVAAPIAKYNFSASGGSRYLKFSTAFDYIDQDGIVQKT